MGDIHPLGNATRSKSVACYLVILTWHAPVARVCQVNRAVRREALTGVAQAEREQLLDTLQAMRTNLLHASEVDASLAA